MSLLDDLLKEKLREVTQTEDPVIYRRTFDDWSQKKTGLPGTYLSKNGTIYYNH